MEDFLFNITNQIFVFFMWIALSRERAEIFFILLLIFCLLLFYFGEKINNK